MAITKPSEILPIRDGVQSPNAYQVLGLTPGETDDNKITDAANQIIAQVKSVKAETDPALWKQIAAMVQTARVTLADPKKKQQLDRKLRSASEHHPSTPQSRKPTLSDPLAGLLPPGNPMKRYRPAVVSVGPVQVTEEVSVGVRVSAPSPSPPLPKSPLPKSPLPSPPLPETPLPETPLPETPLPETPPTTLEPVQTPTVIADVVVPETAAAKPIVSSTRPATRRRSKSNVVPMILSAVTLLLVILVGVLGYVLVFRDGKIAVSPDGDLVRIEMGKTTTESKGGTNPDRVDAADTIDGPEMDPPKMDSKLPTLNFNDEPESNAMQSDLADPVMELPSESMVPSTPPSSQTVPNAPTEIKPGDPETNAGADISALTGMIKTNDWLAMKAIAQEPPTLPPDPSQQQQVERLLSVIDLASYYRTGIERAVAELAAGRDFEVQAGFRVIVVSKTDDSLTVRFDAKIRTFTLNNLPQSMADRLATFQIDEGADREAAKAVYHAILSGSSPGQRDQALDQLRGIDEPIQNADRDALVETLEALLGTN